MSKSELFSGLDDIGFCTKDPDTITQEVVSRYELITGRTLARADPVRLFLNAVILEFVQQRNIIDQSAKMNLLAYAEGSYLDHIGALLGVMRLEASSASCTVRFSLSGKLDYVAQIPQGTRITPDGKVYFATTEDIFIPAGSTAIETKALCDTPGTTGNDYLPGQISKLVDVFPYEMTAENTDISSGGIDTESDEAFRERIHIAPESFSTAGTKKGYEYYALSTDSGISDVSVLTGSDDGTIPPGNVYIYVLMRNGVIPDDTILQKVLAACNGEDVRPDTDYVHVLKPEKVNYDVEVRYWIDKSDSVRIEMIQQQVNTAMQEWAKWQGNVLGRDINPSQLNHDIISAGAKRCEIISPGFQALTRREIAVMSNPFKIEFAGLE